MYDWVYVMSKLYYDKFKQEKKQKLLEELKKIKIFELLVNIYFVGFL